MAYKLNLAGQASIAAKKVIIAKQKMKGCTKICRKTLDRFAINTWQDDIDDIIFPYK